MTAIRVALAAAMSFAVAAAAADRSSLEGRLDRALQRFDAAAATALLSEIRSLHVGDPPTELAVLQVRAGLAVAELLRIDFEEQKGVDAGRRRTIGQRIDATAEEALALLTELPESSERYRIEADLVATMIRSDFRARKYEQRFKEAVAKALELDEANARAWVTAAKPYIFASPAHGGDPDEALRLLGRALELDSGLESARLLRALVHSERGELAAAQADWRAALDRNPDCAPARRRLEGGS